jgi:hypothetical protein
MERKGKKGKELGGNLEKWVKGEKDQLKTKTSRKRIKIVRTALRCVRLIIK